MKIAIIGYGAAALGFLLKCIENDLIKKLNFHIDVYDQNSFQNAGGLGGLKYDGKLIIGENSGNDMNIPLSVQRNMLFKFIKNVQNDEDSSNIDYIEREIHTKLHSQNFDHYMEQFYKNLYDEGLYLVPQYTYHMGTDSLHNLNESFFKNFIKKYKNHVNFHFNEKISKDKMKDIQKEYDIIIISVGRYGTDLLNYFKSQYGFIQSNDKIDIGIRFQTKSNFKTISKLDEHFHEWKIKYKTNNNLMVRTFCHNPKGYVVTQNLQVLGDNICIVNGHSFKNKKSQNTNFAILVSQKFTQPFNDSMLYGKIISQQANLLAGSDKKIILQTLGDFKRKKRTKKLFRVTPTLSQDDYILGDLTYAMPAKIYEAIIEFFEKIDKVIPYEINYSDNLIYGMQTKFYNTKMNDSEKIKFIGDCSGKTRSIISAASMGYMLAQKLIK